MSVQLTTEQIGQLFGCQQCSAVPPVVVVPLTNPDGTAGEFQTVIVEHKNECGHRVREYTDDEGLSHADVTTQSVQVPVLLPDDHPLLARL